MSLANQHKPFTHSGELQAAILCYKAETNQIARLLLEFAESSPDVDQRLVRQILGTTDAYMQELLERLDVPPPSVHKVQRTAKGSH